MQTLSRRVLVAEPKPRWTPELQRQFQGEDVRVGQCIHLADLQSVSPDGLVLVLDFDAAPAEKLQFLGRNFANQPAIRTIALGSPRMAELEWTVRDLGVIDFQANILSGKRLAELCRRQWTLDGR